MSALALTWNQLRYENRAFWRNPAAAAFTFAFPIMFLFIFNLLFGSEDIRLGPGQVLSGSNFYVPAIAAFSVITTCYTNTGITVSFLRDEGVLKRKRGTPMPAAVYMASRILHSVFLGVVLLVIVTAAGVIFYDVQLPDNTIPAFLFTLAVGAAAFCALGIAVTAFVPNADAAPPVVNFSILPLLFISDVFIPDNDAPEWLRTVASFFPIKHYSEAMQTAFNPFEDGLGFEWGHLAVVAVWGVVGVIVATRFFSWEPRR